MQNRRKDGVRSPAASGGENSNSDVLQIEMIASARSPFSDQCAQELALDAFPNDLTRLLYLASLRDCNSGRYLHPQLSARLGVECADQALFVWHDQVFRRLLTAPVSDFVHQLEEYIRYTRMEKSLVLNTWQSLQAYRASIPAHALSIYSEVFYLNVEAALIILGASSAKTQTWSQEAASR